MTVAPSTFHKCHLQYCSRAPEILSGQSLYPSLSFSLALVWAWRVTAVPDWAGLGTFLPTWAAEAFRLSWLLERTLDHFVLENLRKVSHFCICDFEARPEAYVCWLDLWGLLCMSLKNPLYLLSPRSGVFKIKSFRPRIIFSLDFMNRLDSEV